MDRPLPFVEYKVTIATATLGIFVNAIDCQKNMLWYRELQPMLNDAWSCIVHVYATTYRGFALDGALQPPNKVPFL